MSKSEALYQLLNHGALSLSGIRECTGWGYSTIFRAIVQLDKHGLVKRTAGPHKRWLYGLHGD